MTTTGVSNPASAYMPPPPGPARPVEPPPRVAPVEPKQEAAERRAETDRVQSEERQAAARENAEAGPGVGRKIDISV